MSRTPETPELQLADCLSSEIQKIYFKFMDGRQFTEALSEREWTIAKLCLGAVHEDFKADESSRQGPPRKREFETEDAYPYCDLQGLRSLLDSNGNLRVRGKAVSARWIIQTHDFRNDDDSDTGYFRGLAYDATGTFYGVAGVCVDDDIQRVTIEKLTGKNALLWFARRFALCEKFARELCRAIENPTFEFMEIVPKSAQPKRKRKPSKAAAVFHEQLHLATAMVECVRKLDAAPNIENLGDACRSVSALHQAIHAPENFKLAAQG